MTLAWAQAPLDEATLHMLMVQRMTVLDGPDGLELVRRGLAAVRSLVRSVQSEFGLGYELYHPTFTEHIRTDSARIIGQQNQIARAALCALVNEWQAIPTDHPARRYALHYGTRTLLQEARWDELVMLLSDLPFLEARAADNVYALAADFTAAMRTIPPSHAWALNLRLIEQALRRDLHFIARHPSTLFQCLWNSAWWYDTPLAEIYYESPKGGWGNTGAPWARFEPKLCTLLERWRAEKEAREPGFVWIRSIRPPEFPLGGGAIASLQGHNGVVICVAITPDDAQVISSSTDGTLRIWDLLTGIESYCIDAHDHEINCLAISKDGNYIISGSLDNTVKVWDRSLHICKYTIEYTDYASSIAISPDNTLFVTVVDGDVYFYDIVSGNELYKLIENNKEKWKIKYTDDGADVKFVRVRDDDNERGNSTGRLSFRYHIKAKLIKISPDGTKIIIGCDDDQIRIFDLLSRKELICFSIHKSYLNCIAVTMDNTRVVSSHSDNSVHMWDLHTGELLYSMYEHQEGINSVAVTPDNTRIVTGSSDGTVRVWDITTGQQLRCFRGHIGYIRSVVVTQDNMHILSGSQDRTIRIWDMSHETNMPILIGLNDEPEALSVTSDGSLVVIGCRSGSIQIWDPIKGLISKYMYGHNGKVLSLTIDHGCNQIASAGIDNTIRVRDIVSGEQRNCLDNYTNRDEICLNQTSRVTCISFYHDDKRLVSGLEDGTIHIWDLLSGEELCIPIGHYDPWRDDNAITCIAVTPDNRWLAGSVETEIYLWDNSTSKMFAWSNLRKQIDSMVFLPSGTRIILGLRNGSICVYCPENNTILKEWQGHNEKIVELSLFDDNKKLASRSKYGIVKIWNDNLDCVKTIQGITSLRPIINCLPFYMSLGALETAVIEYKNESNIGWYQSLYYITSLGSERYWVGTYANGTPCFLAVEGNISEKLS